MSRSTQQPGPFDQVSKTLYNRLWATAKKADGGVTGGVAMQRLKADWASGRVGPHLTAAAIAEYSASLGSVEAEEVRAVRKLMGDEIADQFKRDLATLEGPRPPAGTTAFKARDAARKRVANRRKMLAIAHDHHALAAAGAR